MRRAAFWLTVAGVSLLASGGLEFLAARVPSEGLRRFTAFVHGGAAS